MEAKTSSAHNSYMLVYQGIEHEDNEALRKIKRILLSDFCFSVDEIRDILEKAPITIQTASEESTLKTPFELLKEAGASVLIVKCNDSQKESLAAKSACENEMEIDLEEAFEFEIDLNEASLLDSKGSKPRVYALDCEHDEDEKIAKPEEEYSGEIDNLLSELQNKSTIINEEEPSILTKLEQKKKEEKETQAAKPESSAPLKEETKDPAPAASQEEQGEELLSADESPQTAAASPPPPTVETEETQQAKLSKFRMGNKLKDSHFTIKKKHKIVIIECLVIVILGLFIVSIAQILSFSKDSSNPLQDSISSTLSQMMKNMENEKPKQASISQPNDLVFTGANKYEDRSILAKFIVNNDKLLSFDITLSTPKPPDLTPEQIVNKVVAPPWLRKARINNLKIKHLDGGRFEASGDIRVFVEYDNNRIGVAAKASLRGYYNASKKQVVAVFKILRGKFEKDLDGSAQIEVLPNNEFRLAAKAKVVANQN